MFIASPSFAFEYYNNVMLKHFQLNTDCEMLLQLLDAMCVKLKKPNVELYVHNEIKCQYIRQRKTVARL